MPTQQPPSLQDIIARRRQEEFVGRDEYVRRFRENLRIPLDDPRRRFIFNVYGQAGVGKTWLLQRLRQVAEEEGCLTAWTNETQQDIVAVLGIFARQLEAQGIVLKAFNERYRAYRQQRNMLEADPEAPKGLPVFLGQMLARVGMSLARQIPFGGALVDLVEEDELAAQVGEWTAYITRRVTNKDEVRLVLEPVNVLTPLFLDELRKKTAKRQVVFFFDSYEHTGDFLDPWLRALLDGRYGDAPANVMWVISGREALDMGQWVAYERLLVRIHLPPFTDEEVRSYLARKGITDPQAVEVIRRLSSNLPLLVAMLAAEGSLGASDAGAPNDTAVDHFLKWAPEPRYRQAAVNAALPRRLNRDIFKLVVEGEDTEDLFTWIIQRPFVQETAQGWVYHDLVRQQMLRHKRRESPAEWTALHKRLAGYYEEQRSALDVDRKERLRHPAWQEYTLESLYHRLCEDPRRYLPRALNEFMAALDVHASLALRWAETIRQAGADVEGDALQRWGERLTRALSGEGEARHTAALDAFTRLIESPHLARKWLALAHVQRGLAETALRQYEAALKDFNRGVRLSPKNARFLFHRGEVLLLLGKYRRAIANFNRVLELEPENLQALYRRGVVYLQQGSYKRALADFNTVLEKQPEYWRALADRGEAYRRLGKLDAALADFNRVLAARPDDPEVLARRGDVYLLLGRVRDAVADFNLALQRRPDDPWTLARRGEAYRLLGYYTAALADFSRALSLRPDDAWALASRGELYRAMGEYEKALADLDRALQLAPDDLWARTSRGVTLIHLGRPRDALKDLNVVLEKQPNDAWALAHRAEAYRRLKQLSNAIRDITKAIRLEPDEDWYLYVRALVYLSYSRRKLAKAHRDLNAAIELAAKRYEERPEDWANTLNLALYHLALGEEEKAEALYREALSNGATPYHIRAALDDVRTLAATISDLIQTERIQRMQRERLGEQMPHEVEAPVG